jgi:hypothetical protein
VVKTIPQQHLEPWRIRHDVALPRRRRRADRYDLDLSLLLEALRQMREIVLETEKIGVRIARPWRCGHVNILSGNIYSMPV